MRVIFSAAMVPSKKLAANHILDIIDKFSKVQYAFISII